MRGHLSLLGVALGLAIGLALLAGLAQPVAAQATPVDVGMGEYVFDPADLLVPAGPVAFNLVNLDSRQHNMIIDFNGVILESVTLGVGEAGTWEVTLDQPGIYEFWCDISNHRERGMVGTLTVQ